MNLCVSQSMVVLCNRDGQGPMGSECGIMAIHSEKSNVNFQFLYESQFCQGRPVGMGNILLVIVVSCNHSV